MAKITTEENQLLAKYIYNISGIYLDQSKDYLLEGRLRPLLTAHSCKSFMDLYRQAKSDSCRQLDKELIDAISTNETLFFRDTKPFELLKQKIIPDLIDRRCRQLGSRKTKIRIWSAACSTGQEVYSIAVTLLETLGDLRDYEITLLGTDISDESVSKASYGLYGKFEIERGLPKKTLQRYFSPAAGGWRVKDEIRSLVMFKKFNLMDSYSGLGTFDIIFCRNVAIYFTDADKRKLFQKLGRVLDRDGYLLIGGSESLRGIAPHFEAQNYLRGIYYQLQGAAEAMEKARQPVAARPVVKKATVKPPVRGKKARRSWVEMEKGPQKPETNVLTSVAHLSTQVPEAAVPEVSIPDESAVSNFEIPETSEIPAVDSTCPAAGFLETAGSSDQSGESLLGNLPAARQTREPLVIGSDAANGEEKKTSLLDKISGLHQDGDDDPGRE